MRIPDPGPLGETLGEASESAIVAASFVKSPFGGCVESVFTLASQRFLVCGRLDFPGVRLRDPWFAMIVLAHVFESDSAKSPGLRVITGSGPYL